MKKKILTAALVCCTLLTLTACKAEEDDNQAQASLSTQSYSSLQEEPEEQAEQEEQEKEEEQEEQEEEVPSAVYANYIRVTGSNVNIRSGAGTGYNVTGTAEQDTLYACTGETDGWYIINYLNSTGCISKNYAALLQIEASENLYVERVIEDAAKLLGTKYVYGAVRYHDGSGNINKNFTDTRFDCSSLTQYVFYTGAGVLLNVTTRTQILQGQTVTKQNLQRGDLMFFTNASRYYNTGIQRVGHVALYLGNNYILHTSSDYAKIEQLSSQRWDYFLQAQRML